MKKTVAILLLLAGGSYLQAQFVENGRHAAAGLTLKLTEEMRFGPDRESDEYLWAHVDTHVVVDPKGNILVADVQPGNYRINMFDAKGTYLKTIASMGQGPGELRSLSSIRFLNDGRLLAFEAGQPGIMPRWQFFDQNYAYSDQIGLSSFSNIPIQAFNSPLGTLYAGSTLGFDQEQGKMMTKTGVFKLPDASTALELSNYEQSFSMSMFSDPNELSKMMGGIITGVYRGVGVFAFGDQGQLYSALSTKYEITRWDPTLSKKELEFRREYRPVMNTEEEIYAQADKFADNWRAAGFGQSINDAFIKRVVRQTEIPEVKNPVQAMIAMPKGYLLVISNVQLTTGRQTADIFDDKGAFVGSVSRENWFFVSANNTPHVHFADGKLFTIETDEDGDNHVVRYAYSLTKGG